MCHFAAYSELGIARPLKFPPIASRARIAPRFKFYDALDILRRVKQHTHVLTHALRERIGLFLL
jgi:hypothetical protein